MGGTLLRCHNISTAKAQCLFAPGDRYAKGVKRDQPGVSSTITYVDILPLVSAFVNIIMM